MSATTTPPFAAERSPHASSSTDGRGDAPPVRAHAPRWQGRVAMLVGLGTSLWLVSPVLTGSHLECFSQRLMTLAISHQRGVLARDDDLFPIFTEYLYTTRLGVVHLLEAIMRLTGTTGNGSFRILLAASLVCCLAACVVFVRRWAAEPTWAVIAALVLTPGLFESSFLFADNLPSAALALAAMALVGRETPVWRWLVAGVLFAAAVRCRLDALYTLPLFPVLFWAGGKRHARETATAAAAFAVAAGAVLLGSWWWTGVSLRVALQVGAMFAGLHSHGSLRADAAPAALAFFGLLLPPLLALGAWANVRRMPRRWTLALVVVPALFYLYLLPKPLFPRMFLLLGLPFLALHGAAGVRLVVDALREARPARRRVARVAVAAAVVLYALPPLAFERDGPRAVVGRLWSPLLWREFQAREAGGEARVRALVDGVRPGQPTWVMSATWQADAVFNLVLLQRGWQKLAPPAPGADLCSRVAEVYTRGDRTLVQYRLEDPYSLADAPPLQVNREYAEAYQIAQAARCIAAGPFDGGTLADWDVVPYMLPQLRVVARSPQPTVTPFPVQFPGPVLHRQRLRSLRLFPVARADLAGMQDDAARVMASELTSGRSRPLASYHDFLAFFQPRYWQALRVATANRRGS